MHLDGLGRGLHDHDDVNGQQQNEGDQEDQARDDEATERPPILRSPALNDDERPGRCCAS